jgi:hypothetical protein
MIICNIQGGLGNQMFQYAMGRSIALERNFKVKFCIDGILQYKSHNGFELPRVFGVDIPLASPGELIKVLNFGRSHPFLRRALATEKFKVFRGSRYQLDSESGYDSTLIDSMGPNNYLHGYWQSEKYFAKYGNQIRKDFSFFEPLDKKNAAILDQIQAGNAVSIHVRRGDYVSNPKAFSKHGVCGLDYYFRAIELIMTHVKRPNFFVFTDDVKWVKQELLTHHPKMTVIDHNLGIDSYRDMQLMSACGHHIIANSSFSWWGAWLNPSRTKVVIAPELWFANGKKAFDLIPDSWIKI